MASSQSTVNCSICCSDIWHTDMAPIVHGHRQAACRTCIDKHVSAELTNKGLTTRISCLHSQCRQELTLPELQAAGVKRASLVKLDENMTKEALRKMPEFVPCAQLCGNGALFFGDGNVFFCGHCDGRTCTLHRIPFHDGLTCREYDAKQVASPGIERDAAYARSITRPCPRCGEFIQRNEGCDHMTCRLPIGETTSKFCCGFGFCWCCGADYDAIRREGNHYHVVSCTHHREPPLGTAQPSVIGYSRCI